MNSMMLRPAVGFVRLWTKIYTSGLPSDVRETRRTEIASDVWHSIHDPDRDAPARLALQMILRLLLGVPDDLGWRAEHLTAPERSGMRTVLAGGALCALVLAGAAALWRLQSPPLPQAPNVRTQTAVVYPPPAPPPAPPFTESGHPVGGWTYGQSSYTVTPNAVAPIRIKDVRPVYPPIAIANDVQGVVVVQATITGAGRVADARVVQPVGLLSQSALDAVQQWVFTPSGPGGIPVKNLLTVRVSFTRP
jgi:TonB family protein